MQKPEQWVDELVDPATSTGKRFHQRKRSSVSVSRFGQVRSYPRQVVCMLTLGRL